MPFVLVSPTAYKGTLSPTSASQIMTQVIHQKFPRWTVQSFPLADGGDGTLEVLLKALKGRTHVTRVLGPHHKKWNAKWGIVKSSTAIIEMAQASGIGRLKQKNKILDATSVGTGELIKAALDKKCRRIVIGVGGTATADGGAGALHALGLRYFDRHGESLAPTPKELIHLARIDWRGLDRRLKKTKIDVVCDVTNPLLGPTGSARVFGPQKGATATQVIFLEKFLKKWSACARTPLKKKAPGAGAAGALAFGLAGFLGARLVRGSEYIMKMTGWQQVAKRADLILSGEGQCDQTSFSGKVIGSIAKHKKKALFLIVCGKIQLSPRALKKKGVTDAYEMGNGANRQPEKALKKALNDVFDFAKLSSP